MVRFGLPACNLLHHGENDGGAYLANEAPYVQGLLVHGLDDLVSVRTILRDIDVI